MLYFYVWLVTQILLESFPISSSGHCRLLEMYAKKFGFFVTDFRVMCDFKIMNLLTINLCEYFVQCVTVVVIALFFWRRWFFLIIHIKLCWKIIAKIIALTFITDFITVLFYLLFKSTHFSISLGLGFSITALILILTRRCDTRVYRWNFKKATALGVVQGLALLPGVSRLAATYLSARWLGIPAHKAFEISWLIQIPLIGSAFLYSCLVLLKGSAPNFISLSLVLLLACAGACAYFALGLVQRMAVRNRLWIFSFYMVIPILLWALLLFV